MQTGIYESENGHRYRRHKMAYILVLNSTSIRQTTTAPKNPFWAHPAGKWASKGAAKEGGGGRCLLTSSGGIICKRHKIFPARQWSWNEEILKPLDKFNCRQKCQECRELRSSHLPTCLFQNCMFRNWEEKNYVWKDWWIVHKYI